METKKTAMEPDEVRIVHGHEGSGLNNCIQVKSDARDENGGAHYYRIMCGPRGKKYEGEVHSEFESDGFIQTIDFQNGPLKEAGLNGVSDEALLAIVVDRLEGFQTGPFRSRYNAIAITHLETALLWLGKRTSDRAARGVYGTHNV